MSSTSDADLQRYAEVMEQIRHRGDFAARYLREAPTFPTIEGAALQMRMMLELVPLAALLSHREQVEAVATSYAKKGATDAAKIMKRVDPGYWPRPVDQTVTPGDAADVADVVPTGFVSEAEWTREWGKLSGFLHARNPYEPDIDLEAADASLSDLLDRLQRLFNMFVVTLPNGDMLVTSMVGQDGKTHVQRFVPE